MLDSWSLTPGRLALCHSSPESRLYEGQCAIVYSEDNALPHHKRGHVIRPHLCKLEHQFKIYCNPLPYSPNLPIPPVLFVSPYTQLLQLSTTNNHGHVQYLPRRRLLHKLPLATNICSTTCRLKNPVSPSFSIVFHLLLKFS
jgi:hypothetical protein